MAKGAPPAQAPEKSKGGGFLESDESDYDSEDDMFSAPAPKKPAPPV
jgi:hypothetical protein